MGNAKDSGLGDPVICGAQEMRAFQTPLCDWLSYDGHQIYIIGLQQVSIQFLKALAFPLASTLPS